MLRLCKIKSTHALKDWNLRIGTSNSHSTGHRYAYTHASPTITPPSLDLPTRLQAQLGHVDNNTKYLVGVAIMHQPLFNRRSDSLRLPIVKRAECDTNFPGMWAVPGGHIEPGETIKQAMRRELREETGLQLKSVVREFEDLRERSKIGHLTVQMNFFANVRSWTSIKLNPKEHSAWMWVKKTEITGLHCSDGMRTVLMNAFKHAKQLQNSENAG